jgi:hypothetical protein
MPSYYSDLIVAANVGIMLFFTVAVAPTVFKVLPPEWSAAYVRTFFPKYFLFLGVTTALAAALAGSDAVRWGLGGAALLFFFNCYVLIPRINAARDAGRDQTFKMLHWVSVAINLVQLAGFIWILIAHG